MTATATPAIQAVTEWSKVFPRQITENYTSSVTFMKQLTVIAVSTITDLKNAFPKENYTVDMFGGLKLRSLKSKCKDELAQFLSTALTQAFDAFDKKYLHQLALCFYENECKLDNLIEYHMFEYSYKQDAISMTISSKSRGAQTSVTCSLDNIREKILHLIKACTVMSKALPLPESYDVSLRLYYNDEAPEGYQAPGFLAAKAYEDPVESTYEDTQKLGWVETPYHKLTLRSYIRDSLRASREAIPSQNPPTMTQAPDEFHSSNSIRESGPDGSPLVRCSCNNSGSELPGVLLTCQYCNTQQHAACYGLTAEGAARVTRHCCVACSDEDPGRVPSDRRLAAVVPRKRDSFAIFRRTLEWCSRAEAVAGRDLADMFGLSLVSASKLMKLLHNNGVVQQEPYSDLMTPAKILHDQLKAVMSQYFQSKEEDIVDQLVAESLASQESQSDPVGDVLSPFEKVSLQNASNLGRVIANPEINNNVEDPTLKQYRDALMVEKMDDELPLSGSHNPVKDMEKFGKKGVKRKVETTEGKEGKAVRSGVKNKKVKTRK